MCWIYFFSEECLWNISTHLDYEFNFGYIAIGSITILLIIILGHCAIRMCWYYVAALDEECNLGIGFGWINVVNVMCYKNVSITKALGKICKHPKMATTTTKIDVVLYSNSQNHTKSNNTYIPCAANIATQTTYI